MLLYFLSSKRGQGLNISRIAEKLGYPDDTSVNKRIHDLEALNLVRPSTKKPLGWELTSEGKEKIWPLTFPRNLVILILVISFGTVVWGIDGLPSQLYVYFTGMLMMVMAAVLVYLYRAGELVLLGQDSESGSKSSGDGSVTVTAE